MKNGWGIRIIAVLFALIPLAVLLLSHRSQNMANDSEAIKLSVWFQFFTANWPNWQGIVDRKSWLFSEAIAFRFALAYVPTYGAGLIFFNLVKIRKAQRMKFRDLLRDRDLTIEAQILNTLPDSIDDRQRDQMRSQVRHAIQSGAML
jgi:hypothetical protein